MAAPLIGISTGFTDYGDYLGIAFSHPLEDLGALTVVLPYPARPGAVLSRLDGLLLGVGRDLEPALAGTAAHSSSTLHSPLRDRLELVLVSRAIADGIPLLGVCRGMQVINVTLGGTLYPDHGVLPPPANAHPGGDWERWERVVQARLAGRPVLEHPAHEIAIEPGTWFSRVLGSRAAVNSYHHQGIATTGEGVLVSARAVDGVIEAIEVPAATALCAGVQWELQEEPDSPLFAAFVEAASRRAARSAA